VVQVVVLDGFVYDTRPFSQDCFAAPKANVCWGEVAYVLAVTMVVRRVDEGGYANSRFPVEEVVFQRDPVFEGVLLALDFALNLWINRAAAHMFHILSKYSVRSRTM